MERAMNMDSNLGSGSGTAAEATVHEGDIGGAFLTQSAEPGVVKVEVPDGQNVVRVPVTANETIELPFPADGLDARLGTDNGNLAIKSGDVTIILQGYTDASEIGLVEIVGSDGVPVDVAAEIAATDPNLDIATAAGPAAGDAGDSPENNGGIFSPFDPALGIDGFTATGGLHPTALSYTVVERAQLFYDPQDDATPLAVDDTEDLAPINYNDANSGRENGYRDTNVMIVLDVSGSMKEDADSSAAGVQSRLSIAKSALSNLLHTYETLGDVRVTVVAFSIGASIAFDWGSVADAIAAIDALSASGVTNYDAALEAAATAWTAPGKLDGDVDNVVYFLSDGKPTWGGGFGNHLSATDRAEWNDFLENPGNGVDHVYAVGIGDDIGSVGSPDPDLTHVANPDGNNVPAGEVIYVTDPLDLGSELVGTVEGEAITGNVLSGIDTSGLGDNGAPGAADVSGDGVTHIYTFNYDSPDDGYDVTFSWDGSAATVTQENVGGSNVSISGREVSFDTESGRMTFNFDTGGYSFTPGAISEDTSIIFHYGTRDADGDVDVPGGVDADGAAGGAELVISIIGDEPPVAFARFEAPAEYAAPAVLLGDQEAALVVAG
jgi:hypothetical protein